MDAVGDGVSQDLLGQPVMCMTLSGGFAEQTLCKAKDLIARPSFMPSTVAAGFTMTYGTSMHALKQRAQLQAGEALLVLGAGGGVGGHAAGVQGADVDVHASARLDHVDDDEADDGDDGIVAEAARESCHVPTPSGD